MSFFDDFNEPETILSICSYPDPKHGIKQLNAVAWHSERTLKPLAHDKQKVIVIAEHTGAKKRYRDGKYMLIYRIWKKGNPFTLFSIARKVLQFTKVKSVLFQFEFNIFGGVLPVIFLPLLLLALKIAGKKIHFELHQVVLDIRELANHINIKNPVLQLVFNIGLHYLYFTIGLFADDVIVLEADLRKRLKGFVDPDKVVFVPITIERKKTVSQIVAKHRLGIHPDDFTILVFGFVNWYKGSDWIVDAIRKSAQKNIRLLMAGGENPTLKDKPYYQKFYNKIHDAAAESKKIILTGFVEDNKVGTYFSAADVVVLPYRVFMSASGPFSFALSYRKPILLSTRLYDYAHSPDFSESMLESHLKKNQLFFPLNKRKFDDIVKTLRTNENYEEKLSEFSHTLGSKRTPEEMVKKLEKILVPAQAIEAEAHLVRPATTS